MLSLIVYHVCCIISIQSSGKGGEGQRREEKGIQITE